MNDINIWGKLFRATVYKSAVNIIGEEKLRNSSIIKKPAKSLLQEFSQKTFKSSPVYIINSIGKDANKNFLAKVSLNGHMVGHGFATTKKEAEMLAAQEALDYIDKYSLEEL